MQSFHAMPYLHLVAFHYAPLQVSAIHLQHFGQHYYRHQYPLEWES